MADLPEVKMLPYLPPFTNTGVDYFGPVEVKRGRLSCKRYGDSGVELSIWKWLFNLDTDACINAL